MHSMFVVDRTFLTDVGRKQLSERGSVRCVPPGRGQAVGIGPVGQPAGRSIDTGVVRVS